MNFYARLLDQMQGYAISHSAWRGQDRTLSARVAKALGEDREPEIRRLIHSRPLADALEGRDVLLWTGVDDLVRLVDAQPSSREVACRRLAHHPGDRACRFCLLAEPRGSAELVAEVDQRGEVVPESLVHRQCSTAWSRLRQLAERAA